MENQFQNELYFTVKLAVMVTALLLMYKYTDYTWLSSFFGTYTIIFANYRLGPFSFDAKKLKMIVKYIIFHQE